MERGKKSVAQKIFYAALQEVDARVKKDPSLAAPEKTLGSRLVASKARLGDKSVVGETAGVADIVSEPKKLEAKEIFDVALKNISPILEVKGRRIGGSNYQVPMEVQEPRKTALGMKWMIAAARAKKGVPMHQRLAQEILDAYNHQGAGVKKREDVHRMAESNKAFAHFARFGQKRK